MTNLNSKGEFFEGKTFDNRVHYKMLKIKINKPRRRRKTAYKGIVNNNNGIK